jgi:hypothetical protein
VGAQPEREGPRYIYWATYRPDRPGPELERLEGPQLDAVKTQAEQLAAKLAEWHGRKFRVVAIQWIVDVGGKEEDVEGLPQEIDGFKKDSKIRRQRISKKDK